MAQRAVSRRALLRGAAALGGSAVAGALAPPSAAQAATLLDRLEPCTGSLQDIDHVVFLIQENRSFDHYFGRYKGVRGFDDRSAPGGAAAFAQAYPTDATITYPNPLLPFHIDTTFTLPPQQGQCTNDVEHQWAGQHVSWNQGANDQWMVSHLATEPDAPQAAVTMGYYDRGDLPFYYALADHFTIGDGYHASLIGGTDANRLYSMTGTMDPDGWDGGLQFLDTQIGTVQNPGSDLGTGGRWKPYPQVLTENGISWKVYGTPDGQLGDNVLRYFPQFRPLGGDPNLSLAAFGSNTFPLDFAADCLAGTLPQVSWIVAGLFDTEHAPAPIKWGEAMVHSVLLALTNSGLWPNTVLFLTYDENGGFFDHVSPPTAPPGTPGEYLNIAAMSPKATSEAMSSTGVDTSGDPIGLGFRVPLLVVSPFSRNPTPDGGPLVCSDVFDHTSMLRFVERWAAAKGTPAPIPDRDDTTMTPGLSEWRRAVVGDLTATLDLGATPDASVPSDLLAMVPNRADPTVLGACIVTGTIGSLSSSTEPIVQDPVIPAVASMPTQEPLPAPVQRPSGVCAAVVTSVPSATTTVPAATNGTEASGGHLLPVTGLDTAGLAATGVAAGLAALVLRRAAVAGRDASTDA